MKRVLARITLAVLVTFLAGCADLKVNLQYAPDARIQALASAGIPISIFRFVDARGDEGDKDVYRVGGVYNGYGMRLSKILSPAPWPNALVRDLGAAFTERGVKTVLIEDRLYEKGSAVTTPLVLTGEIRNFSTENRWAGYLAHVSGIVRVYDQSGTLLSEKPASARLRPTDEEFRTVMGQQLLEQMLNRAVKEFVHQVVTDPELTQRLVAKPGSPAPEDKSRTQAITTTAAPTRLAPQQPAPPTSTPTATAAAPVTEPAPTRPERHSVPASPAASQPSGPSTAAWIVGRWKTISGRSGSVDGAGSFEFWQENRDLRWRMVRNGWLSGAQVTQRASGTVWKASGSTVELIGRYDSSNFGNLVGQSVRHLFSRDGNRLNGYEIIPPDGSRAALSLERVE